MFYLSQLPNFGFCIHHGNNNASFMHLWHEGTAGRGGNEIASYILKTLSMEMKQTIIDYAE